MNLHTLKVTVVDGGGVSIPGAKLYLTDKEGKAVSVPPDRRKYFRGITDVNGNHTFTVAAPTLNPAIPGVKLAEAIKVQVAGYPDKDVPIKWDTPNSMGVGSQVIDVAIAGTQELDDVLVKVDGANKKKIICEQRGGKYIPPSRDKNGVATPSRCILPPKVKQPVVEEESWWDKNKVWVLAGSGILLTTIIIIAVVVSKKRNKK
jgi:hypothetical protein